MTRICHLFESQAPDETIAASHQLVERLSTERYDHRFIALDGGTAERFDSRAAGNARKIHRIPRRFRLDVTTGPRLRRFLLEHPVDLLHAWGLDAMTIAAGALRGITPIVATLTNPSEDRQWSRWFQAVEMQGTMAIATPSGIVQRRAIEAGIDPENTVVIRPGVDFHALGEAKRLTTRESLGLPDDARVLLTLQAPTRDGGHYHAAWAAAILRQMFGDLRIIIPGVSREQRRIRRFADSLPIDDLFTFTGHERPLAELLAVADLVIVAAVNDIPSTPLAWAMAAGVPIVGSAVPAVTEFIADRSNGLLCKPGLPILLAKRIRTALDDPRQTARLADAARSQAFEVFSMRRCADQYDNFFENVLAGRPPGEKISDAAMKS